MMSNLSLSQISLRLSRIALAAAVVDLQLAARVRLPSDGGNACANEGEEREAKKDFT